MAQRRELPGGSPLCVDLESEESNSSVHEEQPQLLPKSVKKARLTRDDNSVEQADSSKSTSESDSSLSLEVDEIESDNDPICGSGGTCRRNVSLCPCAKAYLDVCSEHADESDDHCTKCFENCETCNQCGKRFFRSEYPTGTLPVKIFECKLPRSSFPYCMMIVLCTECINTT